MTTAHATEHSSRTWNGPDAQVIATLLQYIGPVITACAQQEEVVRRGAVLIVKVDDKLMVHQLTAVLQFQFDRQPQLMASLNIPAALGLPPAAKQRPAEFVSGRGGHACGRSVAAAPPDQRRSWRRTSHTEDNYSHLRP